MQRICPGPRIASGSLQCNTTSTATATSAAAYTSASFCTTTYACSYCFCYCYTAAFTAAEGWCVRLMYFVVFGVPALEDLGIGRVWFGKGCLYRLRP